LREIVVFLSVHFRTISSMLLILFQAANQAAEHAVHAVQQAPANVAQAPPYIYVTVQQPSGGMPEWVKILITAAVGALIGIVSNIAMEYVKPWIAKRLMKRTVTTQIHTELLVAASEAEAAQRILTSGAGKSEEERLLALQCAELIGMGVDSDRYDFYFTDQKALVYEIDKAKGIGVFYSNVKQATVVAKGRNFDDAKNLFIVAATLVENYIALQKLNYVPQPVPLETAYQNIRLDRAWREPG
jgi:hypothetical protein